MRSYNRNNRSSGGRRGGRDFRRRDSGRREMHKAVCDECGNSCEVPFKPSGDKPIYCSDCFERKEGGSSRGTSRRVPARSDFGKKDNTNRKLLEKVNSINDKLDRILKVIEPVFEKKLVSKKPPTKKVLKKTKVKKSEKKAKKKIVEKTPKKK